MSIFIVLKKILRFSYKTLVAPKSINKDTVRREFILNILLIGLVILSFFAFWVNIVDSVVYKHTYTGLEPLISFTIFILFSVLLFISRKGKSEISSTIMVILLFLSGIYTSYRWGIDVSQGLLMYALVIIMAGVLISSRIAFFLTLAGMFIIIILAGLELNHIRMPDHRWKYAPLHAGDVIVYVVTLNLIWVISWLSNREIEKSLKRARASERELKFERDQLEIKIEERTQELKRIQLEKITQVYRFAEIGRLTSGFMHDLVSPISLVSLNLHKLNHESQQKNLYHIQALLKRAIKGTRYLENFVITARKQLQNQEVKKIFSLNNEIKHVIQILTYKANKARVKIIFEPKETFKLFGNPIKFNQIVMNLILNAIDSYDEDQENNRKVKIFIKNTKKNVTLNIQDFGVGIPQENLSKIFDPFFTTKTVEKGTGIGLSITKEITKQNFNGEIFVKSEKKSGTIFTVIFPKIYPKKTNE